MRSKIFIAALCLCLPFLACVQKIAGGSTETTNPAVVGVLYQPDGITPAKGAKVYLVPADHNPRQGLAKALAAAPESTVTNDSGIYRLDSVPAGTYNVLAAGSGNLAYKDSVAVVTDSHTVVPPDTLKAPGGLRGLIRLQPGDDARTVFLLFMGTSTWVTPDDSTGKFTVASMAEGSYRVRILTTLDAYLPKDTDLTFRAGKIDTLTHDIVLQYTGIPVVGGLKIGYDTLKQIVALSWFKPTTGRKVAGYDIYRKQQDSTQVKIRSAVADTMYADSTLRASATYEYRVAAVDTQNSEGVQSVGITINFQNRFKLVSNTPAFGFRLNHTSLAFGGKMWVIGGTNIKGQYNNDVWSSSDGTIWNLMTDSAQFPKRKLHSSIVFNGKMWVIGGLAQDFSNDVWSSVDGITWTQATPSAKFSPRYGHASIVFNNAMWVIGGIGVTGTGLNDVWYSADGISWNKATDSAGFSPRGMHTAVSLKNRMWVVAGNDGFADKNDVWYSEDGVNWTQSTPAASFSKRRFLSAAVTDSTMWVFGGLAVLNSVPTPMNDAWYSGDGVNWTQFQTPVDYAGRYGHSSVNFNSGIWIIGGQMGSGTTSDVWSLEE